MFRIGLKFPCNGLSRVRKHGCSRLYLTARYYETRVKSYDPDGRLCKDVRLMSRVMSGPKYSTAPPRSSDKGRGSGTLITLGTITIGTLGILAYAKKDPEVRTTLEEWIPGTDKIIQIVFREETSSSYFDFVFTFFETLKETLLDIFLKESTPEPGQTQKRIERTKLTEYKPPKPAFTSLVEQKEPINNNYTEIRVSKEKGEKVDVVVEKPVPPSKTVSQDLIPQDLIELETYCGEAAAKTIAAYHQAAYMLQEYNNDIVKVVENAGTTLGGTVWQRLKETTEKKKNAVQEAEQHAKEAMDSLKRTYNLIEESVFEAPAHMKTAAKRNVRKILDDVEEAKKKYNDELQKGDIAELYWKQLKVARENFNEELQILFPNINIQDKKLSVSEDAFDLFVLHMYHKVNSLQNELEKLKTVGEAKLKAALKASGEDVNQERLDFLIQLAVNQDRFLSEAEQSKKLLAEQKKFYDEMRRQLKLQSEVHADHLREALSVKEQETRRALQNMFSEKVEAEFIKYETKLAAVVGRLHAFAASLKTHMEEKKGASNAQILWSACQALSRAVKVTPPGTPKDELIRPLESEIQAIYKAAPKEEPLVHAALQSIPEEAVKRGVFPEHTLRERFLKVENVARKLAMVPAEGAGLPVYLLSYLQSLLIVKTPNPIPKSELEDEPIDVSSLNTYDVLQRARYWLDRGNFKMTLKYMNLLKGAPRSIASDWMNETRILLETQQAIDVLLAYAGATGLAYLGTANPPKQK